MGDGDAAGGVAGGAPVVGRDVPDEAVKLDRPGERVQVVGEPQPAPRFDRSPLAPLGDRRRLASLRDLQSASGDGVQQRRLAVAASVLADPDGVLGDQPVAVELGQPVADRIGAASRQR